MKKISKVLLYISSIVFLSACSSDLDFEQIEYFKNKEKWRVFVYIAPDATIVQLKLKNWHHALDAYCATKRAQEEKNTFQKHQIEPIIVL